MLLIPCETGDEPGCEASTASATSVVPHPPAALDESSVPTAAPTRPLTPGENVAAWRARLARQYHFFGV
jgi:hypothetical protein